VSSDRLHLLIDLLRKPGRSHHHESCVVSYAVPQRGDVGFGHDLLKIRNGILKKDDVKIRVEDRESDAQCVQDHIRPDVHLADEVRTSICAWNLRILVFCVVETRQRDVIKYLAGPAPGSDEQKVLDAKRLQTGLVEVDGHVSEGCVDQGENDEPIRSGMLRQRQDEVLTWADVKPVGW